MRREERNSINFCGITHDHNASSAAQRSKENCKSNGKLIEQDICSTIAILRRHSMCDCLVLVKKYCDCLGGYSLEFPNSNTEPVCGKQSKLKEAKPCPIPQATSECSRRKLVSRLVDGDDPMYQDNILNATSSPLPSTNGHSLENSLAFRTQQARGEPFGVVGARQNELVHVPMNGLMDRLKSFTESGVAVDSRVYAFAMGFKTAEWILATGSMKELQETPM